MAIQYAATQWCFPGNGVYAVRNAAAVGLQGLQIELGCEADGYYMAQQRIQQAYLEDGAQYGIEFLSIVLNELNVYGFVQGPGRPAYQIALDSIDLALQTATQMGIDLIMLPLFLDSAIVDDYTMRNATTVLRETCKKAQARGISIAIETPLAAHLQIQLIESTAMPNLSVYYDSQNFWHFAHLSQAQSLELLYPYLCNQLHVKDGLGHACDGGALSCAMLGKGDSDFMATVRHLQKMQYDGWLVLENQYYTKPLRALHDDCFAVMEADVRLLKSLFGGA